MNAKDRYLVDLQTRLERMPLPMVKSKWEESYDNLLRDWVALDEGVQSIITRLNITINATSGSEQRALQAVRDELETLRRKRNE